MFKSVRKAIALLILCCVMLVFTGCNAHTEPIRVNLSVDEKNRLDTFFSNFSEVGLKPFTYGTLSNDELIEFGIRHQVRNKYNFGKGTAHIPADEVEQAQYRYFDRSVKGDEYRKYNGGFTMLEEGVYHSLIGTGDVPPFSQVDELWDNLDGTFMAKISVYRAQDGWEGDPHGTMEEWEQTQKPPFRTPKLMEKKSATIKLVNDRGDERYILLEYLAQ